MFAVRQLTIENEITMEKVKLNYFGKKADFRTWLTKIGDRLLKKSISLDRLVKKSMISDFLVRNKKSRIIDEDLPTEAKYFIFRTAEELKLQNRKNPRTGEISFWYNFNQKYPLAAKTGVYSFSCSGFNDKMDQALILVSSSQGLIGEGKVVVFVRKKGIWIIKNELTLWIS